MPNQKMGRILMDAAELQDRDTEKPGDRAQSTSKRRSGERDSTPRKQPEQDSARNRDRGSRQQARPSTGNEGFAFTPWK